MRFDEQPCWPSDRRRKSLVNSNLSLRGMPEGSDRCSFPSQILKILSPQVVDRLRVIDDDEILGLPSFASSLRPKSIATTLLYPRIAGEDTHPHILR